MLQLICSQYKLCSILILIQWLNKEEVDWVVRQGSHGRTFATNLGKEIEMNHQIGTNKSNQYGFGFIYVNWAYI